MEPPRGRYCQILVHILSVLCCSVLVELHALPAQVQVMVHSDFLSHLAVPCLSCGVFGL